MAQFRRIYTFLSDFRSWDIRASSPQKTSVLLVPPHPKRAFGGASSLRVVSSDFAISRSRPKPQLLQDIFLAVKLRNSKQPEE